MKKKNEEKSKTTVSPKDVQRDILDYINTCNRPVSIAEISINFKNEISKTILQKCLNSLVENNEIAFKLYNKTNIYVKIQSGVEVGNEEISKIENKIASLKESNASLKDQLKNLNSEISKINRLPDNITLENEISSLTKEVTKNSKKIESLKKGGVISKEDMVKVCKEHTRLKTLLKKRKDIFKNILDSILEGTGAKKSAFVEELGLSDV
ncbi:Tat binding protein 1-interacting protein [Hamiltosporidium tvaerminnensis]|uniref:Tat binding protein 1-interacting protein n=1 Tax=Hamiltosporidium tvaerminnensis TaxID=1176355 RepID=A0A4Q9LJJ8_9MICR|nr:Tat binding protein 1-interacting protein [Hamiltosporidium tvaerminnensis]